MTIDLYDTPTYDFGSGSWSNGSSGDDYSTWSANDNWLDDLWSGFDSKYDFGVPWDTGIDAGDLTDINLSPQYDAATSTFGASDPFGPDGHSEDWGPSGNSPSDFSASITRPDAPASAPSVMASDTSRPFNNAWSAGATGGDKPAEDKPWYQQLWDGIGKQGQANAVSGLFTLFGAWAKSNSEDKARREARKQDDKNWARKTGRDDEIYNRDLAEYNRRYDRDKADRDNERLLAQAWWKEQQGINQQNQLALIAARGSGSGGGGGGGYQPQQPTQSNFGGAGTGLIGNVGALLPRRG